MVFVNHVNHVLAFKSNNVLQTRFSRGFVASIYEIIGPVGWETVSKSKCKNVRSKAIFFYFGKRGGGINMPRSVLLFLGFNLLFFFCFYTESCIVIDKQLNVVKSDGHRARAVQLWKLCMADESLDRPSGRSDLYLVFLVIFF